MKIKNDEEVYEQYEAKTKAPQESIKKNLTQKQITYLGIATLATLIAGFYTRQDGTTILTKNLTYLLLAAIAIITYALISKSGEDKIITIQEARAILKTEIKQMQKNKHISDGQIDILPVHNLRQIEGKPILYLIGVQHKHLNGRKINYQAEINPYNGYFYGLIEKDAGFQLDKQYIQFVRTKEDKWDDTYGKGKK